jgi:hypothetical protein
MGVFALGAGTDAGETLRAAAVALMSAAAGDAIEVGTGEIGPGCLGSGAGVGTSGAGVGAFGVGLLGGPRQPVRQRASAVATNFDIDMAAL